MDKQVFDSIKKTLAVTLPKRAIAHEIRMGHRCRNQSYYVHQKRMGGQPHHTILPQRH